MAVRSASLTISPALPMTTPLANDDDDGNDRVRGNNGTDDNDDDSTESVSVEDLSPAAADADVAVETGSSDSST